MEVINKDLVPYTTDQEEHFTAQAPMLFGNDFMKNVTVMTLHTHITIVIDHAFCK